LRLLTSKKLSLIVVRPNGSVKFEGRKVPCSRACREHHVPGVKVKVLVSLPQLSGQEEGGGEGERKGIQKRTASCESFAEHDPLHHEHLLQITNERTARSRIPSAIMYRHKEELKE
jgi:hypothetical protein